MTSQTQPLIGVKQIAAYLHCDERTVRRWRVRYALPVRRVAGRIEASAADLDAWRSGQDRTKADIGKAQT